MTQEIKPGDFPEHNEEFRHYFDGYLDLCEFTESVKLGLTFILGAVTPQVLNTAEPDKMHDSLKTVTLYSRGTFDFSSYGDLNDYVFSKWIYNYNIVLFDILGIEEPLDNYLRKIPGMDVIIGKADIDEDFRGVYCKEAYTLNTVQNLNDDFFEKVGQHLYQNEYSTYKAYDAGVAYRMMMLNMDIKGTIFLLSQIRGYLSPLYQSLFYAPYLYVNFREAFVANHLFSQILQNLVGGSESDLGILAKPVHRYHQFIIYEPGSVSLRELWPFGKKTKEGSAVSMFMHAVRILEADLSSSSVDIQNADQVYDRELIGAEISLSDFLNRILKVLHDKYSINGYHEFTGSDNNQWSDTWNNKGDYIQFLALLYYETAIHALALKDLKET